MLFFNMIFTNSLPINYHPWQYFISIGQGYLVIHLILTKFAIVVASLSSYFVLSKYPVTGLTTVTDLYLCLISFPSFLLRIYLLYLHRFYSLVCFVDKLSGNLWYLYVMFCVCWQVFQQLNTFCTALSRYTNTYVGESLLLFYPVQDEVDTHDAN